jgi:endonuclease V-like protein UPF0215 family
MSLENALARGKRLRTIGFDDSLFDKADPQARVGVSGVVCNDTRFEGMVYGRVRRDGTDATQVVLDLLKPSKFLPQLHLAMFDGIAFGGFNVLDLPRLAAELAIPCVAVMRDEPDLDAVHAALEHLPDTAMRRDLIAAAGPIHAAGPVFIQVAGTDPELAVAAVARVTHTGHIPEPIRLAHLIGSAIELGESGRRA